MIDSFMILDFIFRLSSRAADLFERYVDPDFIIFLVGAILIFSFGGRSGKRRRSAPPQPNDLPEEYEDDDDDEPIDLPGRKSAGEESLGFEIPPLQHAPGRGGKADDRVYRQPPRPVATPRPAPQNRYQQYLTDLSRREAENEVDCDDCGTEMHGAPTVSHACAGTIFPKYSPDELRQAVIAAEILGRPKSLRKK